MCCRFRTFKTRLNRALIKDLHVWLGIAVSVNVEPHGFTDDIHDSWEFFLRGREIDQEAYNEFVNDITWYFGWISR